MTRWKAASVHLAISATLVGSIIALLLLTWYPPAYVRLGKLGTLVVLLGGIDVMIGPLLTLIVFKSGKPRLKLDLAIIGLLQLSALSYGLHILWQSRPVFLVAVPDRFELVYANEIDPADLAAGARPEFRQLSLTGPRLVGASLPILEGERFDLTLSAAKGHDLQTKPGYFVPYDEAAPVLARHGLPLEPGPGTPTALAEALTLAARNLGKDPAQLVWVPITSGRGITATMLIDASTGAICTPVDVDPWSMPTP